jgi:hypothetical protein
MRTILDHLDPKARSLFHRKMIAFEPAQRWISTPLNLKPCTKKISSSRICCSSFLSQQQSVQNIHHQFESILSFSCNSRSPSGKTKADGAECPPDAFLLKPKSWCALLKKV